MIWTIFKNSPNTIMLDRTKFSKEKQLLTIFLVCYGLLLTIFPSFIYHSILPDSAQNIAWGNSFSWGYTEHPPLGAWFLSLMLLLFRNREIAVFFASSLCLTLSLFYTYKTSRLFLAEKAAVAATILSSLSYFYMVNFALQYNQNSIMLPFWVMSAYYFWRAFTHQTLRNWLFFSFIAALSMMAKYESAIILFIEGVYLLINSPRINCKKYLFIGLIFFLVLMSPHLYWLIDKDCLPIRYLLERSHQEVSSIAYLHLYQPLIALFGEILNIFLPLLIFYGLYQSKAICCRFSGKLTHYLVYLGWAPLFVVIIISSIFGIHISAEWGFPLFSLTLPGLFLFFSARCKNLNLKQLVIIAVFIHLLNLTAYTIIIFSGKHLHRANYPSYSLANIAQKFWAEHEGDHPIEYVGGFPSIGYYLSAYLPSKPHYLNNLSLHRSPWINPLDLKKKGALLVLKGCDLPPSTLKSLGSEYKYRKCFKVAAPNKFSNVSFEFSLLIIPSNNRYKEPI